MYLPSLQKNIQELDRQISLLENECECMETDKREIVLPNKINLVKELPNTPFVTGPSISSSTYLTRMRIFSPVLPKMYSSSCRHSKTMSDKLCTVGHDKRSSENNHLITLDNSKPSERKVKTADVLEETQMDFLHLEKGRADEGKPNVTFIEPCKRPMSLIKEVSESSDENVGFCLTDRNRKKNLQELPKGQTWSELPNEKYSKNKKPERKQSKSPRSETLMSPNFLEQKFSSDEENYTGKCYVEGESKSLNAKWSSENEISGTPRRKNLMNRRPRSARTQKNKTHGIPLDLSITKTLQEKEIQCTLDKEERENTDFLFNLNHAVKELIQLIGKLKAKSSREKNNEVLNDMQNTLSKISKLKSINTIYNSLNILGTLNGANMKFSEDEENILVLRKTLLGIKKFCKELTEEKSILTEELAVKSHTLENLKSKEKEYLSLISSLKFNLEKMKEEAEEGVCARRDLKFLKMKLQEETKVIEALKKSHEKMQELVENYVLENDKLRTQLKIIKLESQKFNVLLAGKEMEINKYKKEIESFQRQITEQLKLLRSKATENEIGCALETINNQTNFLQTESEFNSSEAIFEKVFNEDSALVTTETASECFSVKIRQANQNTQFSPPLGLLDTEYKNGQRTESKSPNKMQITERSANDSDSTCKSNDFVESNELDSGESNSERHLGLQKVLSSSKNLRSSIDELLEDFRRENSDNQWSNLPNSYNTSSQTTLLTVTSDDAP